MSFAIRGHFPNLESDAYQPCSIQGIFSTRSKLPTACFQRLSMLSPVDF